MRRFLNLYTLVTFVAAMVATYLFGEVVVALLVGMLLGVLWERKSHD